MLLPVVLQFRVECEALLVVAPLVVPQQHARVPGGDSEASLLHQRQEGLRLADSLRAQEGARVLGWRLASAASRTHHSPLVLLARRAILPEDVDQLAIPLGGDALEDHLDGRDGEVDLMLG